MNVVKRKICVVTGTRAEYGLLYWLMKEIKDDLHLSLQVIVTGMHLSPEFGLTYRQIENDGFAIDAKVEMLLSSDSPRGIAKSMGLGTIGFADALSELKPDIVVVLGDRYEILSAVQAAMVMRIPVAHLHGGEATEGLIDEAIRHSLTKMSQLHFVANEEYRRRVIQLGEKPESVFCYGAVALDNIEKLKLLERLEFEKSINFKLGALNFLVTYHPVTLKSASPAQSVTSLLKALESFPDAHIIFTKANSDTDGRVINEMVEEFVRKNPGRSCLHASLGQLRYLSAIKNVDVVIGNSSSGIVEAPALKKPTVNLGDRQKGRMKAQSIIDCAEDERAITEAIKKGLSANFQQTLSTVKSLYGSGNASFLIKEKLKSVSLENILMKKFYDLPVRA